MITLLQNIHLLLIEDDPDQSAYMERCLSVYSFKKISIIESAETALLFLQNNTVDLIISDINLNGDMSGLDLAKQLLSHLTIKLPVILISSQLNFDVVELNPDGYLLKPIKTDQLLITIQIALHRFSIEQQLFSYQEHLKQAQQLGNMGSWEWDILSGEISWTDHIYRIFGLQPQQTIPSYDGFLKRVHPDDQTLVSDAVTNALENHDDYDIEHRIITPDGIIRHVHQIGSIEFNKDNRAVRMIGSLIDISERTAREKEITFLAFHDSLTGLPNRSLLIDRLNVQLATAKRSNSHFAVLFIDLNKFKPINDNYGHKAGDLILQKIAQRLNQVKRDMDTVARIGGDEFIFLIPEIQTDKGIDVFIKKIKTAIEKPVIILNNITINISASIGVALYPQHGTTADELLMNSDNAMYENKKLSQ